MDRVFSVGEISDQFWAAQPATAPAPTTPEEKSKMNRSASEWAFQRFLQEASASDSSPPSASDQNDVVEIKIKEQSNPTQPRNSQQQQQQLHANTTNTKNGSTASFGVGLPPNVPIDSEEYQAFLKTKLNLACAAVALSRVSYSFFLLFFFWIFGYRENRMHQKMIGWCLISHPLSNCSSQMCIWSCGFLFFFFFVFSLLSINLFESWNSYKYIEPKRARMKVNTTLTRNIWL